MGKELWCVMSAFLRAQHRAWDTINAQYFLNEERQKQMGFQPGS